MAERSRVIVTGGSGKLGRATVDELLAHGYEVIVLDSQPPAAPTCPFTRTELTDFGQTLEAILHIDSRHQGVEAIVHLAAIAGPGRAPDAAIYLNNSACTFNVFQAARRAGIRNLVWASSETLLGVPFEAPPPYLPLDEEAPPRPETAYALSKLVDETIAQQFCRWDPALKMTGLRLSNVVDAADYANFPAYDRDPQARRYNLWSYIDARDGAQAIRLALERPAPGLEIFIIANADTVMRRPNAELLAAVFPDVPLRRPLGPHESLLSIEKARRLLGFEPRYGWRR